MKTAKRVLSVLIILFLALKFSPYGYLIKGVKGAYFDGHTSAHIYDRKHFDQREMPVFNAIPLAVSETMNRVLDVETREKLEAYKTAGLVVVEQDEIVLEEYWNAHDPSTMSNSFSMAKSIITMLVQIAVQDGYIDSWDDPITKYIPEYDIP